MRTSYFWKALHEPSDTIYVSVSRQKCPGAEHILVCENLAPSWELINLAHRSGYSKDCFEEYKEKYYRQLSQYDPQYIYDTFKYCTLICYESSKDLASGKKFCHRRMIAGWIETELGITVPEETRSCESHLIVPAIYK